MASLGAYLNPSAIYVIWAKYFMHDMGWVNHLIGQDFYTLGRVVKYEPTIFFFK
jgi:hypothetical protein